MICSKITCGYENFTRDHQNFTRGHEKFTCDRMNFTCYVEFLYCSIMNKKYTIFYQFQNSIEFIEIQLFSSNLKKVFFFIISIIRTFKINYYHLYSSGGFLHHSICMHASFFREFFPFLVTHSPTFSSYYLAIAHDVISIVHDVI